MRLLLDTHTFIWWDSQPTLLSPRAFALLTDPANVLILSVASLWEIQIKHQIGKLNLRSPLPGIIAEQQAANAIEELAIAQTHVLALDQLPTLHKDPFDRILVAQAICEQAVLVSADSIFAGYPVRVEW